MNFPHCFLQLPEAAGTNSALQYNLADMCFLASLLEQANKETASRAALEAGNATPCDNILVMLADDDCDERELFEEGIAEISKAIRVKSVENGMQLMVMLNKTGETLPAVIFLDLNMPGKSGKECLVEIRNNPRFNDIPVVIYSTSSNNRDIQDTHGGGANLYVSKPNTFKGLVAVVTKVLALDLDQLRSTPPINQFVISADAVQ